MSGSPVDDEAPIGGFDLSGAVRRIRRRADLSQRELAAACGIAQAVVARAETGRRSVPVDVLSRAAELAGLRLALLDADGAEVGPMATGAVRDAARRRYPAHLDTRYGDDGWWHGPERYTRGQPWYTFDRDRTGRDGRRARLGTPEDHRRPRPGDAPDERAAARRYAGWVRRTAARQELARRGAPVDDHDPPPCTCPPTCDEELDVRSRHDELCACRCDNP